MRVCVYIYIRIHKYMGHMYPVVLYTYYISGLISYRATINTRMCVLPFQVFLLRQQQQLQEYSSVVLNFTPHTNPYPNKTTGKKNWKRHVNTCTYVCLAVCTSIHTYIFSFVAVNVIRVTLWVWFRKTRYKRVRYLSNEYLHIISRRCCCCCSLQENPVVGVAVAAVFSCCCCCFLRLA